MCRPASSFTRIAITVLAFTALTAAAEISDYPKSLLPELIALQQAGTDKSTDINKLTRMSNLYLDLGDDYYTDQKERRAVYLEGQRLAERILTLQETNPDAHFLVAAHLGSQVLLDRIPTDVVSVSIIRRHLERALQLQPDHARALQFMGGMFAQLPWFLGGNSDKAIPYFEKAIAADQRYTNARLQLAKLFIKKRRISESRMQLEALIATQEPHYATVWAHRFKPEAEGLLRTLDKQ